MAKPPSYQYTGAKHDPALAVGSGDPDRKLDASVHAMEPPPIYEGAATHQADYVDDSLPTEDELKTLRRVADHIPWRAYTIAFVELVERMSYYGTTQVSESDYSQMRRISANKTRYLSTSSSSQTPVPQPVKPLTQAQPMLSLVL